MTPRITPKATPKKFSLKFAPQPQPIPAPRPLPEIRPALDDTDDTPIDAIFKSNGVPATGYYMARWSGGAEQNGSFMALRRAVATLRSGSRIPARARVRYYVVMRHAAVGYVPGFICIDKNKNPRIPTAFDKRQIGELLR